MKTPTTHPSHDGTLNRLARIAGQVQGIRRMIEEQKYCIDIVTQLQATRAALRAVELQVLQKHMSHCVQDAFASGTSEEAQQKMDELLKVMKKQM
jgi:CsoR family transcriptional regulator, copper-sensing transcriptional repressor